MSRRAGGFAAMAAASATWGTLPLIVQRADAPESVLVCLRMGFGAIALAAVVVPLFGRDAIPKGRVPHVLAPGVLLALNWVLFFRALRLLPGATPVLIGYVFPLLVALAAPVVLSERREPRVLLLAAVGFAGLVVVLAPEARVGRADGVVAALGSALTAAALVIAARHLAQRIPGPVIALWQNATGATLLLPWALATGAPREVPWAAGATMGVVHTAATGVLFFLALSRVPAQEAGVLMYLEPVVAVVVAWLFLAQPPASTALVGGALVVAAGIGTVLVGTREEAAAAT